MTAEEERETVAKFMQSHDLQHPSIITPKKSRLQPNTVYPEFPMPC